MSVETDVAMRDLESILKRIELILAAVSAQAEDEGLWCPTERIGEACLQEALRDLHRVIESGDEAALKRICEKGD